MLNVLLLDFQFKMLPCASKSLFNIDCPICGFQRSLIFLINGDFKKSFFQYPPLIPVCILLGLFMIHLFSKQLVTRKLLDYSSVIVLLIITVSFVTKLMIA
jgi:hypothetical protein